MQVWHHGDFAKKTARGGFVILGRSDATLNPGGVRIGTAEIYRLFEETTGIKDSLVFGINQNGGGEDSSPPYSQEEYTMNPTWLDLLKKDIRTKLSPRHVPHLFLQVKQLPYTPNGKKMELFCRDFFSGTKDLSVLRTIHPAVCEEYLPLRTAVLTPINSQTFSHQIGKKKV